MKSQSFCKVFFLPFVVGVLGCTARATSFDAVTDFSSSNPSGSWTYGDGTTGSSFTPFTVFTSNGCNGFLGIPCWQPPVTTLGVPLVYRNDSGRTLNITTVVVPTGVLVVHPGPSVDTIVTWTAPSAGTYNVSGFFELLDVAPTGIIAEIFNGSRNVYTGTLTGPAAQHPATVGGRESFSLVETVAAGTTISFGVNNDGNFLNDSTGFDAKISQTTATPEPTSLLFSSFGLAGLYFLRRVKQSV